MFPMSVGYAVLERLLTPLAATARDSSNLFK